MDLPQRMASADLRLISVTPVEIRHRLWVCVGFEEAHQNRGDAPHLAFLYADRNWREESDLYAAILSVFSGQTDLMARVHSECILGEAFGSTMCDCGDQMQLSMDEMVLEGTGAFIYLRQEGRGIGLRNKLDALALQYGFSDGLRGTQTYTSDEANLALGHPVDARDYAVAAQVLRAFGIQSVKLISGNPHKIGQLSSAGVQVASAVDLWRPNATSARALMEIQEKVMRGYVYKRPN